MSKLEADPVLQRILEKEMELPSQLRADAVLLKPPGFSHPIRLERIGENLWVLIYGTSEREILFMNRKGLEKLKNMIEKEKGKKDYRAMIRARAKKSTGLRQRL